MAYTGFDRLKSMLAKKTGIKNPANANKKSGIQPFDKAAPSGAPLDKVKPPKIP